jgi:hypothetical protein
MNRFDLPLSPSRRTLRQFALLWLLFFGWLAIRHGAPAGRPAGLVCALLGGVLGPAGLAWPGLLRPVFIGWVVLVFPVGRAVSRLALAGLYYGVITPAGVCSTLLGHDALRLRRPPGQESYWVPRPVCEDHRRYLRPY